MNTLKKFLTNEELFDGGKDWALLILRVIPSFYLFFYHGMGKITAGTDTWESLGAAALSLIGISFGHVIFGFLAALSEGVLTWFVLLGLKTRLASFLIMMTMFFAGSYHLSKGEGPELAFIYFAVYFTLFLRGPGNFSLDANFES
jgi:putative oxidoreductase